jgi:hypothetical protein
MRALPVIGKKQKRNNEAPDCCDNVLMDEVNPARVDTPNGKAVQRAAAQISKPMT